MLTFREFYEICTEDIETRRRELRQRQKDQVSAQKERVADYHASQRERKEREAEREALKREIKQELEDS